MIKNMAIGKGGLLTKLDPRRWNHMGGGFDWVNLMAILAGHNPDIQFWVCSKVDLKADDLIVYTKLFPRSNVHFKNWKFKPKKGEQPIGNIASTLLYEGHTTQFIDWIRAEGVHIDAGIFDLGIASRINIPNKVPKITEPDKMAKPAVIAYAMSGPTIQCINELAQDNLSFSWISVHFDPKCDMIQRDLECDPKASFAQHDYVYEAMRYRSGQVEPHQYHHQYMALESTAAFGLTPKPLTELLAKKTVSFAMALNGMNPTAQAQNRWPKVKAALEAVDDVKIYGKWEEDFVPEADRAWLASGKFGGVVQKAELDVLVESWWSTMLSPTGKGWSTAKFYECLMAGVMPIFAPDYDLGQNLDVPKFLRLPDLSAASIRKALTILEDRDVWYGVMHTLRTKYLSEDVLCGRTLNNLLMEQLDPGYIPSKRGAELLGIWDSLQREMKSKDLGDMF